MFVVNKYSLQQMPSFIEQDKLLYVFVLNSHLKEESRAEPEVRNPKSGKWQMA